MVLYATLHSNALSDILVVGYGTGRAEIDVQLQGHLFKTIVAFFVVKVALVFAHVGGVNGAQGESRVSGVTCDCVFGEVASCECDGGGEVEGDKI